MGIKGVCRETASEAVRQAVGGGCQSGWGRLLSVTNAVEVGICFQGDSGWEQLCDACFLNGGLTEATPLLFIGQYSDLGCGSRAVV